MKSTRRMFLIHSATVATGLGLSGMALADAPAQVTETDPVAASLGYKADATKVDKAKFAKYAAGQSCASCQLYSGKAGDATGPCGIFAGKLVSSKGWCSAYAKKA